MINLELTTEDAELFKEFQHHHNQFKILLKKGVFNFHVGSFTIHKNGKTIKRVDTLTVDSNLE